jgi:cytochrome c peroxidase
LFHDKILSANRNIACATCHSHNLGGSDGLSLGIGEGGHGIGLEGQLDQEMIKLKNVFLEMH